MTEVLVTGASGFVGEELVKTLAGRGERVRGLVRTEATAGKVAGWGATPVRGDVRDIDQLRRAMSGCRVVYHVAGVMGGGLSRNHAYEVNVTGTENVLAAARLAGVETLVYVSAAAVLLGSRRVHHADETTPLPFRPLGHYAATKAAAERRVLDAAPMLHTVSVRPPLVWGRVGRGLVKMIEDMARRGPVMLLGSGRHAVSTCHVENLCAGLVLAAEKGRAGEAYFVTDGAPIALRTFFTDVLQRRGLTPRYRSVPMPVARAAASIMDAAWHGLRPGQDSPFSRAMVRLLGEEFTVDDAKARRELGYTPPLSRAAGYQLIADSAAGEG